MKKERTGGDERQRDKERSKIREVKMRRAEGFRAGLDPASVSSERRLIPLHRPKAHINPD